MPDSVDALLVLLGLSLLTPALRRPTRRDLVQVGVGRRPLSARTVRYVHTVLRRALADAVRWNRLARNPADLATPPSAKAAKAPKPTTWTADELRTFLDSVHGDRLYPLWLLLATTGLRRGEAVGLRWRDLDLDAATMAVTNARVSTKDGGVIDSPPKSGHGRAVALDSATVAALRAHRKHQATEQLAYGPAYEKSGYVFTWEDGRPIRPDYVWKSFQSAVAALAVQRIRLHDLRHTWATLALRAGVNPKVVSERLGHASVGFTLGVYSHVMPDLQVDAAATVAALIVD